MTTIEIIAVVSGLLCVGLTVRQNIWCWPVGLVMVSLYIVIFFDAKLYSDMLLQVIYVGLQIYGWHAWLRGGPGRSTLAVSTLSGHSLVRWAIVCVVGTGVLGTLMSRYTDASFPYPDAFTTTASLVAQWLLGRKILESWLLWIVVDVVSIALYSAKALYLTAGLYAVFLGLATLGFVEWKKSLRTPEWA